MAIYHCSLRTFSRTEGHSAVAAAAYRAGARIRDERTGRIHRYENRTGVKDAFILAPKAAPENFLTRAFLWNAAETAENRKNSRVAREVILALPHELSDTERKALARDMALYLIERYRVAVDIAVHSPAPGDGHDPRNHHAHLLFTTREVNKNGLGAKTRVLDDKTTGPQEIEVIREVWETLANDALHRAGFPDIKIDRRTLEAQGVDRIPQTHEGKASKNAQVIRPQEQSRLAKAFQDAEQTDDDGDSDEDAQGEKGSSGSNSSSGSSDSGSGSQALTLTSKVREDHTGRTIDYPAIDQAPTRTSFNEEIKAVNEQRAAFGDKPLTEQIAQLDRLMERLDRRLDKLEGLKSKTFFPLIVKHAIQNAVSLATALLSSRKETGKILKLKATEKQRRTERQIARYGRNYRAGLQNRIKDMQQNMDIVQQKKEDFRRYKSFIDTIDQELKKHTSITTPVSKPDQAKPKRPITAQESKLKLHLKAEMIRSIIPEEFKPKLASGIGAVKSDKQTLSVSTAINRVLQTTSEPITITAERSKIVEQAEPRPIESEEKSIPAKQPEKPLPTHSEEIPIPVKQFGKPEERQNWFVQGSEETKPFAKSINQKLDEIYEKEPFKANTYVGNNKPGDVKSQFTSGSNPQPEKRITTEQFLSNIEELAEELRAHVPEKHLGKPYSEQGGKADNSFNKVSIPETSEKPKQPLFRLTSEFSLSSNLVKNRLEDTPYPSTE